MRSSYSTPAAFISANFDVFQFVDLFAQNDVGVFENGLDQAEQLELVAFGSGGVE